MSAIPLKTPVFDGIRAIHFFNGRLLSGEDLRTEQQWNDERRRLLARAIGAGIVEGFEVSIRNGDDPVVTVEPGLAINGEGTTLSLPQRTDVSLVEPEEASTIGGDFSACIPVQFGAYLQNTGVYLLTVCPARGSEGRAPVSGLGNTDAPCNRKYDLTGVAFRSLQLKLTNAELAQAALLRNRVAYKCFQPDLAVNRVVDPFQAPDARPALLEKSLVGTLTDCEVPLALLYWNQGIGWVDLWSVRRPVTPPDSAGRWSWLTDAAERVEGAARFLQFQAQLLSLVQTDGTLPDTVVAAQQFDYLPAAGAIPVADALLQPKAALPGFFSGLTTRGPAFIEGARFASLIRDSFLYPPIDLRPAVDTSARGPAVKELVWLYFVRENAQVIDTLGGGSAQAYVVFASGQMPYVADARFDVAKWQYANYALDR